MIMSLIFLKNMFNVCSHSLCIMHFCFEDILLLSKCANFLPSIVGQQSEIPIWLKRTTDNTEKERKRER